MGRGARGRTGLLPGHQAPTLCQTPSKPFIPAAPARVRLAARQASWGHSAAGMRARFSVSPGHSRPRAPPWACCCSRQPGPVCAAGSTRPLHCRLGGCEWTQVWVLDLDRVLHLPDRRSVGQRMDCWPPWEGWSGVTQAVRPHCSGSPTGASSHLPPSGDITRDPVKMQTQTSRSTWGLRLCISNQSEAHPGATGPPGAVFTSFNVRRVPCSAPPRGLLGGPLCNSSRKRGVTKHCTRLSDVLLQGTSGSLPSVPRGIREEILALRGWQQGLAGRQGGSYADGRSWRGGRTRET